MSFPSKSKSTSYSEAARTLSDQDVQEDLSDACRKLAHAMSTMLHKFDAIAKQIHTIDLLRHSAPLKPRWDALRKASIDLADLLWQFRTNAGEISGRLKLFCTTVLPMAARNLDTKCGGSTSYAESLQVLQSYMTISAEHSAHTRTLLERALRFSAHVAAFVAEFTKLTSRHAVSGQKEMCDLSQRLSELEHHTQHLFSAIGDSSSTEATHVLFTSSRMVASSGRASGKSKITRKQIVLEGDLASVGNAYAHTDRKRSEVAHAQYSAQLRQSRTDPLACAQTMVCSFLLDELLTSESGLSLFLSLWSRLRSDCSEIYHWLKNPVQTKTPAAILCFAENQTTLYVSLANALDVYAAGVDPSHYSSDRQATR